MQARPIRLPSRLSLWLVAALLTLTSVTAANATNGYFVHGYGTACKAMAGACAAMPQDTLTIATNPAGLAFVGQRYDVGLAVFSPSRKYTVEGAPTGFPGTFGLTPGTVESDSNYHFVP
jgi:long-chain fatty acid transport protein